MLVNAELAEGMTTWLESHEIAWLTPGTTI
jgi:hypothetical protein